MLENFFISLLRRMGYEIILIIMGCPDLHRDFVCLRYVTIAVMKLVINTISPVIFCHLWLAFKKISGSIIFPPYIIHRLIRVFALINRINTRFRARGGTWLIIIIDQIDVHSLTTIGTVPRPIIDYIISIIH